MPAIPADHRPARESLDGRGAGDHDLPYTFGRLPRAVAPSPFSTRQFARLLVLRGRVRDQFYDGDDGSCPEVVELMLRPSQGG